MKTNPVARYLVRIRIIMVCVAIAAIAGLELYVGASVAAQMGQTTACHTQGPQAPNVDLSDLMNSAR
jgi:hypothetical protein